jgi:putative transposase
LAEVVFRNGCKSIIRVEGFTGRECPTQEDVCRFESGSQFIKGDHKKALGPDENPELVTWCNQERNMALTRACKLLSLSLGMMYYVPKAKSDDELKELLVEFLKRDPSRSLDYFYGLLRKEGHIVNRKRKYRVYAKLGLQHRSKKKRRLTSRNPWKLQGSEEVNQCWIIDFMSDSLMNGRRFRVLNLVDDFCRKALGCQAFYSIPAGKLVELIDQHIEYCGTLRRIRCDNGPELLSRGSEALCSWKGIVIEYIQPGKPQQNA